jgi:flagellar basal body rod protein FlgF
VDIFATALGGLDRAQFSLERGASRIARAGTTVSVGRPVDGVDLSRTVVDLLTARHEFAIHMKLLQTADDLERRALDILA